MRTFVVSMLVLINIICESTIFQYTRILGIKPDFTIMLLVAYSIMWGSSYSTAIGLASGLLLDLLYGRALGPNALAYMITGYIMGQSYQNVFKDSYLPAVVFNIGAVFIYQNIFFILTYFSSGFGDANISYLYALLKIILPQCLYNGILGGIVYRYLYALDEKRFMNRNIY